MSPLSTLISFLCFISYTESINNGLARTPPMGWLSWEAFRCQTDCTNHPTTCINNKLYEEMADHMANDGYKAVGYNFINIDDCWSTKTRNAAGEQVPDPKRFPGGIKGVADYVHNLGLKLGLYNDIGTKTCGGYTGIDGNYVKDANQFASWDIDMIKIDGCYAQTSQMYQTYPEFGNALNHTSRKIIYSCSWPAYISGHGETNPPVYHTTMQALAANCNLWRNYGDIQDSFSSIMSIVKYWRRDYNKYASTPFLNVAGPGNWNDPDMIIVGDAGLTMGMQETQFALWAIFAAPLLMSNDLRSISANSRTLLLNKEVIDINQDALGKQGGYIWMNGDSSQVIWMRELADTKSIAVVLQNTAASRAAIGFQTFLVPSFVSGWSNSTSFKVRNLLNHTDLGTYKAYFGDNIASNSVGMYKMTLA